MVVGRVQAIVQLNDELIERLDRRAAREGVSRSRVIRTAVEAYLEGDDLVDQQIIDGYRKHPQSDDALSRSIDRQVRDAWADLDW
jgi:predicted DNA-binding protein